MRSCPLCQTEQQTRLRHEKVTGDIFQCGQCDLIFKSQDLLLSWPEQKARYDLHHNEIDNPGYVEFFEQLLAPLRPLLRKTDRVLDWGSGPGERPVLAELLRREGLQVDLYDPLYQPRIPEGLFEVITCTEVVEHFQEPANVLQALLTHLSRGGIWAGMTNFHQGPDQFATWWYAKDPTHVVFYSEKTWNWIAKKFSLRVLFLQSPVFILQREEL